MRNAAVYLAVSLAAAAIPAAASAEPAFCSQIRAELASLGSGPSRPTPDCSGFPLFGRPTGCPGLFGRIFGGGFIADANNRRRLDLKMALSRSGCDSLRAPGGFSTVRTLCVRTCDGYYFPISNSASRRKIKADLKACQAMYPGGGAELYTQRYSGSPDSDATIVSLKGKPYAEEPFAFRYRTSYDPACAATFQPPAKMLAAATPVPKSSSLAAVPEDSAALSTPLPRAVRIVGSDDFYVLPPKEAYAEGHPARHPLHLSGLEPAPVPTPQ